MRQVSAIIFGMVVLLWGLTAINAENVSVKFKYLDPIPNSRFVSRQTSIILRTGNEVTAHDVRNYDDITISGSDSGRHDFNLIISDDNRTAILKPYNEFYPGENVTVRFANGDTFQFTISPKTHALLTESDWQEVYGEFYPDNNISTSRDNGLLTDYVDSLPSDFPVINVPINDNPASGYVFLANHGQDYGTTSYLMILNNDGSPIYYRKMSRLINDFKLSRSNLITYSEFQRGGTFSTGFYAMNQAYAVVDSFRLGNGYSTDQHAFKLLDNYHSLLIGYDSQVFDMRDSISGGDSAAVVIGLIVQELDSLKNVVFQWRSWDHFSIMDSPTVNYLGHRIDYVHGNAVDLDTDDNLIISCRAMNEVTKIDRNTGDIIWRLGKNAIHNEFTFFADTAGFSAQHHCRILPDGHLTVFDNGNYHTPQYSRAVEYELDEDNMTCTQVWEYRNDPDIYGGSQGSAQRLANGNTMIGWGGNADVTATEVRPDGSKAYEINIGDQVIENSYRAYRFNWTGIASEPYLIAEQTPEGIHLVYYQFGASGLIGYIIYGGTEPNPTAVIDTTTGNYYYLTGLPGGSTYYFRVTSIDYSGIEGSYSNEEEIAVPYYYLPGDVNMTNGVWPPEVIGSDVTYLVNFFRGVTTNPACLLSGFYCSADVNGDCNVIGSDVTYLVNFFRGGQAVQYCPDNQPAWPSADDLPDQAPAGWPYCGQ